MIAQLGGIPQDLQMVCANLILESGSIKIDDDKRDVITNKELNFRNAVSKLLDQMASGKTELSDVVTYKSGGIEFVV